jgi:histidyl-tRNA synthetase
MRLGHSTRRLCPPPPLPPHSRRLQAASKAGCHVAVILGQDERAAGLATVKDMRDAQQWRTPTMSALCDAVRQAQCKAIAF